MPDTPSFGSRILILVPHPDDEIVAYAATIARAKDTGAEIFALYLTNGCIARDTLWPWQRKHYDAYVARRRAEGEAAAKFLGITPIGWHTRSARYLWRELPQIKTEIETAIAAHNIDQLWLPAYEGGNADHDGLNAVGSFMQRKLQQNRSGSPPLEGGVRGGGVSTNAAANNFGTTPFILEFAEYNYANAKTHSQSFPYPNGTEQTITLMPQEQTQKREALSLYISEKQNLNYVDVRHECFRPLASYDYSQPPHPGTLWYARFQWVPFRHPRVDFTSPEDVSQAIVNFLANAG
jgi:LmbE family N-acetylglucosaminyl deacetylase